jgi:hypothetical protein
MITPELTAYIKEQLAAGVSTENIRTALVAGGWPAVDVDEALKSPTSATMAKTPETVPAGAAKPTKNKTLLLGALIAVALLLLAWGLYALLGHKKTVAPSVTASPSATPTATFQDTGISFSYNGSWKKIGEQALFSGHLDDAATPSSTPETVYFFFSPAHWEEVKAEINAVQSAPPTAEDFGALFTAIAKLGSKADFNLTRVQQTSALESAQSATKTICTGSNYNYSTDNPVNDSRIQSVVINGVTAYLLLPEQACDFKEINVLFNSARTIATPTPTPLPGVTIEGGASPSSQFDSFSFGFNGVADLQHLTSDQQLILNSIKFL